MPAVTEDSLALCPEGTEWGQASEVSARPRTVCDCARG